MLPGYWHKQTPGRPLFPDLLWSRPENRVLAGKLLIIGGNAYGFAAPAEAYAAAAQAGIGVAQVLLPESVRHMIGRVIEAGDFAPSTPSGSFSQKALDTFLARGSWADAVLLAGDLGRNSETAILLEKFVEKYAGPITLTKDAVDYFTVSPSALLSRSSITLAVSFAQLQRLALRAKFTHTFTFSMDLLHLVDALHDFTRQYPVNVIVKHLDTIAVASNGEVGTTLVADLRTWRVKTAAYSAVWWLQNPAKPFEALATAVYSSRQLAQAE